MECQLSLHITIARGEWQRKGKRDENGPILQPLLYENTNKASNLNLARISKGHDFII